MASILPVTHSLLLLFFVTACSANVDFSTPYHLTSDQRVIARIDPALAERVESSQFLWEGGSYQLGAALARVIENRDDAPTRLDYVTSELSLHQGVSLFLTGMAIAEYTVLVKCVMKDGKTSIIEGRGRGVSYWNSFNAGQEAIEKAVLDLATKLRATLH